TPASSAGATLDVAARTVLQGAAAAIYPLYHLVSLRPATDLAARFLDVERLDRVPRERDPLGFVTVVAGRPSIDVRHRALAAARRLEDMLGVQVLPLENGISNAARDALPTLLEPMATLPVQLRMLGLAGVERAQMLLETAQDLRGQDGAAAIAILGEPACTFP